ncbi:hypothetical protein MATL_G00079410 [Megalops atlanticus]|uniref:Uncharacterized protein n=1 Tax=Megalops atlanticus TaxID=7932 RepID=A0A9D3TGW2_MEGAT|nr:hypothetical protein MATL_G00079410 [Megalops atlanticus]
MPSYVHIEPLFSCGECVVGAGHIVSETAEIFPVDTVPARRREIATITIEGSAAEILTRSCTEVPLVAPCSQPGPPPDLALSLSLVHY